MRWLWLVVILAGCGRASASGYCCDDPSVCATVVDCSSGQVCDLAGAYGPSNLCVVPPVFVDASVHARSPCTAHFDCIGAPGGPACVDGECLACAAELGCSAGAPRCTAESTCGGCEADEDCGAYGLTPYCGPAGGCVQCVAGSDCPSDLPICDQEQFVCRGCERHADCDSGVCHLGNCADPATIVYVAPGGVDEDCSANRPCASIGYALVAALREKVPRLVLRPGDYHEAVVLNTDVTLFGYGAVLHGDDSGRPALTFAGADLQFFEAINVFGLRIEAGTGPGVHVIRTNGGLSEVTVVGSADVGVVVESDFDFFGFDMAQSKVLDNAGGGIRVDAGTFGLSTVLIAGNGSSTSALGGVWAAPGATVRLQQITVAHNQAAPGVACGTALEGVVDSSLESSVVYYNACAPQASGPSPSNSSIEGGFNDVPPGFVDPENRDYHLRADSLLINAHEGDPPTNAFDLDGDPRTVGLVSDWGADEWVPPGP